MHRGVSHAVTVDTRVDAPGQGGSLRGSGNSYIIFYTAEGKARLTHAHYTHTHTHTHTLQTHTHSLQTHTH